MKWSGKARATSLFCKRMANDTVCAIATPPGTGATAMIRVSGPGAFNLVARLLPDDFDFIGLPANTAKYTTVYDKSCEPSGSSYTIIDRVILTKFVSPHSFTGEDVVEISCHGSVFIQRKIVGLLIQCGCRMALPGEFTQRAFMSGKLDLPQAEAVSDLINAQSESAHALAMRQLQGGLSSRLALLRDELLELASLVELELDFSEEDVEFADRERLSLLLDNIEDEVETLLKSVRSGNLIKRGVPVAIVGSPNVGKSTLMNAILQKERAIVSDLPGTTRDTVEDFFTINGVLFRFIDTAGIRVSDDVVETIGIERTMKAVSEARVLIYVFEAGTPAKEVSEQLSELKSRSGFEDTSLILVANKCDKAGVFNCEVGDAVCLSAKSGKNVDILLRRVYAAVDGLAADVSTVANERHYSHLCRMLEALREAKAGIADGKTADILAEDIRSMLDDLGMITGAVSSEDILENIFGKFCIGK